MHNKIPKPVSARLGMYYRQLQDLHLRGTENISSSALGELVDLKPSQIRKDLSYFGGFGKRGTGYSVDGLLETLEKILGINRSWDVLIVGAGKLGCALANFPGLQEDGFFVRAIVDRNPGKIGTLLEHGLEIQDVANLEQLIEEHRIEVVVLAVPPVSAQSILNRLPVPQVKGVLNFSTCLLTFPEGLEVENVNISLSFKSLSFKIVHTG